MGDPLRDRQSLGALTDKKLVIEIAEQIGSFERIADGVRRDLSGLGEAARPLGWRELPVRGRLVFARAGDDQATLSGQLYAGVPAVCQRCLEPFVWALTTRVQLYFVTPGSQVTGNDDRELWELTDDLVTPIDIVDELLVMALPLAARHEDGAGCSPDSPPRAKGDRTRPFANLKSQMGHKGTD